MKFSISLDQFLQYYNEHGKHPELLKSSHYKSLEVEYVVDESIIGGIVIRIGDRVVDSSVKTRIDKMRKMLS